MISPHFPVSARMNSTNCSGVMGRVSIPMLDMRPPASGRARARAAVSLRRLTISRGVPLRAPSPSQGVASNPGRPLVDGGDSRRGGDAPLLGDAYSDGFRRAQPILRDFDVSHHAPPTA